MAQRILLTQIIIEKFKKQDHCLEYLQGKKTSLFLDDLFLPAKNDVYPVSKCDEIIISKLQDSDNWEGENNLILQIPAASLHR